MYIKQNKVKWITYISKSSLVSTRTGKSLLVFTTCMYAKLLQLCPTLCDPMDCSPACSSIQGILQVRILQWVAIPSSRGSSQPRGWTLISMSSALAGRFLPLVPPGKPQYWPQWDFILGNWLSRCCENWEVSEWIARQHRELNSNKKLLPPMCSKSKVKW